MKIKEIIILILVWGIGICLVNPIGDFPLNDDWQYAYPVMKLVEEGRLEMQGFFAPNILLQVGWGSLWCWIAGVFSFTILRFSTLAVAIAGSWLFIAMSRKLNISAKASFIGALILISSPLFFNLSFSFMTDVPFMVVMLAALLAVLLYIQECRLIWLLTACLLSIGGFLIRQPGILLMPVLGIWIFLTKRGKEGSLITFLSLFLIGVACYLGYEEFIKPLIGIGNNFVPVSSLYLETIQESPLLFVKELLKKFVKTWVYFGFFGLPFLPFLWQKIQGVFRLPSWQLAGILAGNMMLLLYLHSIGKIFPFGGNILYNWGLGPELLMDVYTLQLPNTPSIPSFWMYALNFLSQLSASILFMVIWQNWILYSKTQKQFFSFLILLSLLYVPVMSITSFFDRYLLLPIAVFFLLLMPFIRYPAKMLVAYLPMTIMGVFSLLATHDYLSWNRAKNDAFLWLQQQQIPITQIDAGFEYNGFYNYHPDRNLIDGKSHWWVTDDIWVISFGTIPAYQTVHTIEYHRWLWGGIKDDILISKRMDSSSGN